MLILREVTVKEIKHNARIRTACQDSRKKSGVTPDDSQYREPFLDMERLRAALVR